MAEKSMSDSLYFTINEVAEQVGVVPATIRNWEKAGLFTATRSPNGYRVFDLNDIEYLKKIKCHSKDNRIGINGIRMLCSPQEETRSGDVASRKLLSSKWKECRQRRGYRLDDVAKNVGVSSSYLSRIENGQANVSLEVLRKLADFYGENILYYLNDSSGSDHLVREGEGDSVDIGIEGLALESLINLSNHTLSVMRYTAKPGAGRLNPSGHSGEEFVYILEGEINLVLNKTDVYSLHAGDSFCFQSSEPHSWYNHGSRPAVFLWVYTPLTKL